MFMMMMMMINKIHLNVYHVLNNEVHFVVYFYITELINARKMKHIKITIDTFYKICPI